MYDVKTKIVNICNQKFINICNKEFKTTSICLMFRIGSVNDFKSKNGLSYIVFYYLIFSSNNSYNQIKNLCINFEIEVKREYIMLLVDCDDEYYEKIFKLLMSMFTSFNYDEDVLTKTKAFVLQECRIMNDDINSCLDFLIHESVFTRQVIGKNIYGKSKTLICIKLSDLYLFYTKYYNNKNIFSIISSKIHHKIVLNVVQQIFQTYSFKDGQFNSFKKYRFSVKSKYLYRNFNICHCALIYKSSGIREYHNHIYLCMLEKVLKCNKEAIFGEHAIKLLNIQQFIYNRVGLFTFYFVIMPENIKDIHQIIYNLSKVSIDNAFINKIVSQTLFNSKHYLISSNFMTKDVALHFIHLKKIKKHGFDIGIMNSIDFIYLREMVVQIFNQFNVALCITGPKINKNIVQLLNKGVAK